MWQNLQLSCAQHALMQHRSRAEDRESKVQRTMEWATSRNTSFANVGCTDSEVLAKHGWCDHGRLVGLVPVATRHGLLLPVHCRCQNREWFPQSPPRSWRTQCLLARRAFVQQTLQVEGVHMFATSPPESAPPFVSTMQWKLSMPN